MLPFRAPSICRHPCPPRRRASDRICGSRRPNANGGVDPSNAGPAGHAWLPIWPRGANG